MPRHGIGHVGVVEMTATAQRRIAAMRSADQMAAAVTRAGTQASWVDDDLT